MNSRTRLLTRIALVAVSVSLLQTPPMYAKQTPWDGHIGAGREALQSGNYIEARRQLDDALNDTRTFQAKDPRLAETYYCLGELYLNEQNYGEAKQYYQRALELQQQQPGFDQLRIADTLYGLATASEMSGDRELATILLKRVREVWLKQYGATNPKLLKVLKPLGIYATVSGDFATAEQCYRQLVSIEEATAGSNSAQAGSALNLLSMTLSRVGKYSESEPVAQRAVRALATSADYRSVYEQAMDNLSYIDHQLGKPEPKMDGAVEATTPPATAATTATPVEASAPATPVKQRPQATATSSVTSVTPQAMAPISEGDNAKVEYKTQPKISMAPPVVNPLAGQSKPTVAVKVPATTSKVQTDLVMRPPTATVKTEPDEFRPWELADQGKNGGNGAKKTQNASWGTISYLASGRLITPEEYQAMLLANEAYELIRQEKYKMACDILYRALGICPELASVHTNLGLALSQVGNRGESIDHLKQAIAIDPKKSAPWINLASTFQIDGQLRASVATYQQFVKRFPTHPLTPKATEIVTHLSKELREQNAVETALGGPRSVQSLNEYLAYATHPGEMRWPSAQTTLRVYIPRGTSVSGYRPEYDGFCQQAFKDWAAASSGKLAFEFVKQPDNADISWGWTDDFSKVASVAEGGEAKVDSSGKAIKHATITVLTQNPSIDTPLSGNQVRAVCLHEIGHALGIIGHSPRPEDIMYCSMPAATIKPTLSPRDLLTIQKLYQQGVAYRHSQQAVRKG
jgi:tetratricopeptide (TPR) repeat protein